MSPLQPTRRSLLAVCVATVAPIAGCSDTADDASGPVQNSGTGTDLENLDLREANVVDVSVTRENGRATFEVALHHDDEGEGGYANWWQVESLDGERLGRRDLTHPHAEQPFTRSETVDVPADTSCVVVRGHDQTHGYGGQTMLVAIDSGAVQQVRQGAEPASFDASDCP